MPIEIKKRWMNDHSAELEKSVALPEAGATAYTDPIDLGEHRFIAENAEIEIYIGATAAAAGKKVTVTPEHSSDGGPVTYSAAPLPGMVVTGGDAGGTEAFTTVQLCPAPANIKRYLRLAVTVEADAGDLTASKAFVALVPQPSRIR